MVDFGNILAGLQTLLSLESIIALIAGTVGGMVIGALPGFSAAMGVSLLIPITYGMGPVAALSMLVAMYTSAIYGGSITAILCHTPGTPLPRRPPSTGSSSPNRAAAWRRWAWRPSVPLWAAPSAQSPCC